jgi:hypothetical protein
MFQATLRTITELLDSKKAAYSFLAVIFACVLHLGFGVSVSDALLLISPLGLATAAQAHVDAAEAKSIAAFMNGAVPPGGSAPAPPPAGGTP